jgi:hypothetical protein
MKKPQESTTGLLCRTYFNSRPSDASTDDALYFGKGNGVVKVTRRALQSGFPGFPFVAGTEKIYRMNGLGI